jgi:hypothetical protein
MFGPDARGRKAPASAISLRPIRRLWVGLPAPARGQVRFREVRHLRSYGTTAIHRLPGVSHPPTVGFHLDARDDFLIFLRGRSWKVPLLALLTLFRATSVRQRVLHLRPAKRKRGAVLERLGGKMSWQKGRTQCIFFEPVMMDSLIVFAGVRPLRRDTSSSRWPIKSPCSAAQTKHEVIEYVNSRTRQLMPTMWRRKVTLS